MNSILSHTMVCSTVVHSTVHPGFIGLGSKSHNRDPGSHQSTCGRDLLKGRSPSTLSYYLYHMALWCEASILHALPTALLCHQHVLEALWGQERWSGLSCIPVTLLSTHLGLWASLTGTAERSYLCRVPGSCSLSHPASLC